ncbi:MAG TPA: cupredoxin domain-containing protein [Solirubrobacterales bacterium]|nr:cupredoxin domain-containing protein [Solirubrobacterales bacterium]
MKKIALLTLVLVSLLSIQAAGVAQGDGSKKVGIVNFAFKPGTLTVGKGTKVEFENESNTAHTATRNGGGFNSGRIRPGNQFSVRFNRTGTFRYHCTIHPEMRGKIVVQ